jgi:hypothetical protein
MNLNKKLVLGTSIGLAIIGLWLVFRSKKPKQIDNQPMPDNPPPNTNTNPNPNPPVVTRNDNFPLKKGSYGARVKELQLVLLKYDANALSQYGVDGDFGTETENALFKVSGKKTVDTQSELDALKYSKNQFY